MIFGSTCVLHNSSISVYRGLKILLRNSKEVQYKSESRILRERHIVYLSLSTLFQFISIMMYVTHLLMLEFRYFWITVHQSLLNAIKRIESNTYIYQMKLELQNINPFSLPLELTLLTIAIQNHLVYQMHMDKEGNIIF